MTPSTIRKSLLCISLAAALCQPAYAQSSDTFTASDIRIDGPAPTVLLIAAIAASVYSLADYVAEVGRLVRS